MYVCILAFFFLKGFMFASFFLLLVCVLCDCLYTHIDIWMHEYIYYILIYMCIYIYILQKKKYNIYIYIYTCIYIYNCIHIYLYKYTQNIDVHACMCVCMRVCNNIRAFFGHFYILEQTHILIITYL